MARTFGQTVPLPTPQDAPDPAPAPALKLPPSRFGAIVLAAGTLFALFWIGIVSAFIWGLLGPQGLNHLTLAAEAAFCATIVLPAFLFMAIAAVLARSAAMGDATKALLLASARLFAADEVAANDAARLARVVRRELDGLNTGLDVAFQRMRTLEAVLEKQISTLDDAGARALVRSDTVTSRLHQESARLEALGEHLGESAGRASETVAGRAAQLKAMIESAEGTLKMATQSLDVQAAGFRAAITQAAETPLEAAKSLEVQASRIEQVADTAMSRAEFVLARQEKHRAQMGALVQTLKEDGTHFEQALSQQRRGMEQAIASIGNEVRKFETMTGDGEQHLEALMASAAARTAELTSAFVQDAERLQQSSEAAGQVLSALSAAIKNAGDGARTLIGESAAQAKHDAKLLVGEAMGECEKLLRASGAMSEEAGKIRSLLAETTKEVERHLLRLPGLAQEEARRVRQMMATETEQILDLSARTLSTLHARTAGKAVSVLAGTDTGLDPSAPAKPAAEPHNDGLKGLARRLTARKPVDKSARPAEAKNWEMKTLLAAAEQGGDTSWPKSDKSGLDTVAIVGALELALADIAIDLSALERTQPGEEDWKRYLAGDRAVFARRLADTIDGSAVDRITALYRDDTHFHEAADAYLSEFETLLARTRADDGGGGLLTSTLLSADTGKVYLAIAYALGRL